MLTFNNELKLYREVHANHVLHMYGYAQGKSKDPSSGQEKEQFYIVTEFASGGNLEKALKNSSLSLFRKVLIAKEIASGLRRLHEKGIIHKDIKPDNIVLVNCSDRLF